MMIRGQNHGRLKLKGIIAIIEWWKMRGGGSIHPKLISSALLWDMVELKTLSHVKEEESPKK